MLIDEKNPSFIHSITFRSIKNNLNDAYSQIIDLKKREREKRQLADLANLVKQDKLIFDNGNSSKHLDNTSEEIPQFQQEHQL
ncbi:3935_t:CDS:2 [Entrophospora sp. SA101]|nr:3935_t:CDS:2 [Entrophospora sp. SA101]